MTTETLQALRRLLFFSVEEAAELIGGVTPRSWQYWERGQRRIPEDVDDTIRALCVWRQKAIEVTRSQIAELRRLHGNPTAITLTWYPTRESWLARQEADPLIYWRPHCSAIASIAAEDAAVVVVAAKNHSKRFANVSARSL